MNEETQLHIPTQAEINAESVPTRKLVLTKMRALLTGKVEGVTAADLSVSRLAREAGIKRGIVTGKGSCADLGTRFLHLAERLREPQTPLEFEQAIKIDRLSAALAELEEAHRNLLRDRDEWKSRTQTTLRLVQLIEKEKREQEEMAASLRSRLKRAQESRDGKPATGLYVVEDN
jgi:hypothetical protein